MGFSLAYRLFWLLLVGVALTVGVCVGIFGLNAVSLLCALGTCALALTLFVAGHPDGLKRKPKEDRA